MLAAYPLAGPRTGESRPALATTQAPTADGGKRLGWQVQSGPEYPRQAGTWQAEAYKKAVTCCK
jgi:hypothetical protein